MHCKCQTGYGRKEAAELLLEAGARIDVENAEGQTPLVAAQLNRETHMVTLLEERLAGLQTIACLKPSSPARLAII